MKRSICFIINPVAGFKKDKSALIDFLKHQFQEYRLNIYQTKGRGDATEAAAAAVQDAYETVVAVGGDGTVNEVAAALVQTDTRLGILPIGSGNGLARSLNIPSHYRRAVDILKQGSVRRIDVGRAGHRYFCAVAGIGIDAAVGHQFDRSRFRGPLPYFLLTAREIFRYKPPAVRLSFQHQTMSLTPFLLTFANTQQFGNGAVIAPQAVCDDGMLDLCLVPNLPKFEILVAIPRLFNGTLTRHKKVRYYRVSRAKIEKETAIAYHVDGEPEKTGTILDIEIIPRALNLIVPG